MNDGPEFNALFLGSLIICGVLSVVFLLYFNRVFASIVSWAIRTWTWHQYGVYIDIQALQISLLAGRIFFTGLRYHGNNETILVQNGHITWAYWLRRVREVSIDKSKSAKHNVGSSGEHSAKLPCRINVSLLGLEWFIYNRTPAYDSILSDLTGHEESIIASAPENGEAKGTASHPRVRRRRSRRFETSENDTSGYAHGQFGKANDFEDAARNRPSAIRNDTDLSEEAQATGNSSTGDGNELPLLLQMYPIYLSCEKAAVVMGNENTKAVLVVKADLFTGEIDASETETPDLYRQFYRLKFQHPVIEMRENQDFKEEQADRATRENHSSPGAVPPPKKSFLHQQKRRALGKLRDLVPYWQKSVESISVSSSRGIGTAASHIPGSNHWQGLSRYLDDGDDQKARWASSEYAAVPTLLDSPEASLTIFWDVVTTVSDGAGSSEERPLETTSNINGDVPPAWAINLTIRGGSVNYGPWADRRRADLQRMFAPSLCKDAVAATRLPVGANRVPTQFKLYVELEDTVNIRIPIREESKNWRWKGKEPDPRAGDARTRRKSKGRSKKTEKSSTIHTRPYGWLDLKVGANATVSYSMDMVASASGFTNTLNVDLPTAEISSSLNHEILWKSGRQRITCDLSNPLRWNALRQWRFNIDSEDLQLFLLRDHVFLLIDLVDDWASGPPADYLVFTPFKYHVNFQLHNVQLFLNVNDANIVDNPTDLEDNAYVVIKSPLLQVTTCIPIDNYRPSKNTIPFDIRAETGIVDLHVPHWNTQAAFLASKEVARLENLVVEGSYNYNATTSPSNTDTLILNVTGQSPIVHLYGFVVRYFMKIKDNYFGDDIHFRTLEEYQDMLRLKAANPEAEMANKPPPKKSNDLDVILSIRADDPKILLPANLYSSQRHVQIDTACLSLDLRFTNYYMELDLVAAPLNLSLGNADTGAETPIASTSSTQLFIDSLHIYGHRLFGLPPTEPTYLCNWDINAGAVTGECTTEFLTTLMNGGKAFAFSFDDDENALISLSSIIMYDVSFLRAAVQSVRLWLHIDEAAFLFSTGRIDANYNDWARSHYSRRADITVPDIKLSCVNAESATRQKNRSQHQVETDALLETELRVAIIGRKVNFSNERKLQQELVRREDQRTRRTPFLLLPSVLGDEGFVPDPVDPPAQSVPPVPLPVTMDHVDDDRSSLNSRGTSRRSRGLRHKDSFLSLASSGTGSIFKPYSSKRSSVKARLGDRLHPFTSTEQQFVNNRTHVREVSASTRHSAYYSTYGDYPDRQELAHNTVAFSSPYFAPYFPLESIRPSQKEAVMQSVEDDETDAEQGGTIGFDLSDVDPDLLSEDCAYSSILVELPSGLTAFCNPTALRQTAALLSALQPTDPEDIIDSLQTDSMKEIFSMQKEQKMKGSIQDILVRVPKANVRFINSDSGTFDPRAGEQDQFDLVIKKLAFASRSETKWDDAFRPESKEGRNSFHLRLNSAEVSAVERSNGLCDPQAVALALVENVMVSVGSKGVSYFDVDIGNIQGNASSEKIEYLASLVHRTSVLAAELGSLFSEASSQERHRLQELVRSLVEGGKGVPDPSVLVRSSAALRSASQHLRTFDSWKLIMRLRQIWSFQPLSRKEKAKLDCLSPPRDLDSKVIRQNVVAAFQKWRSWDLENLEDSVLLNLVFGPSPTISKPTASQSTMAVARLKRFQLALDPGPKQNEVILLDLTARVDSKPQTAHATTETGTEGLEPSTVMTIECGDAAVNLNWELCEMAGGILRMIKRMQSPPTPVPEKAAATAVAKIPQAEAIHCVMSLGHGSFTMEAINLHASSSARGIKASLLNRRGAGLMDTNFILACDTVNSSLRSHSHNLAKFLLEKPSVFVSHELQTTHTTDSHTIKTTASSRYLSLVVKQDPINLAETLDLVVQDEIAQLYRLKHQLPTSPRTDAPKKKISDRLSAFRVNVAMFMDEYTVSLPLLRNLTYTVHGTVSRAAMAANFGKEIIFDFDIKENSHEMQIRVNDVARTISLLQIPPTNGQVKSHIDRGEHSISVFASLELVQLDASAVYSLLSALNRPEITNSLNELQQQGKVLQEHIKELSGERQAVTKRPPEQKEKTLLAYQVNLTFAGLEIFGNSPLKSREAPLAHISFALDSIHLRLANRVEQHGPTLLYPEFHVNLRHIAFDIRKGTPDAMRSCGNVAFGALITASSRAGEDGKDRRFFDVKSDGFEVNLSPETVSTVVDVLGYMGDKIKDLDTSRELEYLRKLRQSKPRIAINDSEQEEEEDIIDAFLSTITYTFEICDIQISWLVNRPDPPSQLGKGEDLVISLQRIEFGTRTRNSARLTIENLQVQMVPQGYDRRVRSANSALLPEVVFSVAYVSTSEARRLAFQAVGKSLDLRVTSGFIVPAANLNDSISLSLKNVQQASQNWNPVIAGTASTTSSEPVQRARRSNILGTRRLESLLIDADFAGAVVHLSSKKVAEDMISAARANTPGMPMPGKRGQLGQEETPSSTTLQSPGLALKVEFRDNGKEDPSLYGEIKIDASSNTLYPSVVPLIVDMSNSVKEMVSSRDSDASPKLKPQDAVAKIKLPEEDSILSADPTEVLGRMKLNLGLRIRKQEFSLSCQPIARVAATASFEDVYFTANTVRSHDQGNFFAISGAFTNLQASVQHVYSRESTGSFKVESIVISLMNSKHVSGISGVSAILKVSPMEISVNAKQLQDFMLFREIWVPQNMASAAATAAPKLATETSQGRLVQRYQQVAATAAFPWTASIAISALKIDVDLGQALGKASFAIKEFWISSKKTSDWEQDLCLGFKLIGIESTGRMSGFVTLQDFKLRSSIEWPERQQALNETPRIQASVGFSQFRVKAAFDYQAFLVADITLLEFLMYNIRHEGQRDRLVAFFDGEAVQVFGTTSSAAQGVALYQAFQRLVQERKANFESSLKEIERFMKRNPVAASAGVIQRLSIAKPTADDGNLSKSPISLDTQVIVTLQALNLGVFPSTFSDHQVFKMEALNAQARFEAKILQDNRIHSTLGLTLGQLRIGLAGVRAAGAPKALSELSVEDVVASATGSRGGTILKVPRVEAIMETWQRPDNRMIDYIFKSSLEGKVEVGWNYSRISYIRGMWANHAKTLAQTWGRELPAVTAIRVTGVPEEERDKEGGKITAEVKVPQSRYEYTALEPPVIQTPQLRDMGDATPPLEWIGLHRDRLPNLTHQIVIVALLELAGEVEDAYQKILGSS
ncbi:hypothetical protein OQA88_12899 [Cercophora sp. LCS_1]